MLDDDDNLCWRDETEEEKNEIMCLIEERDIGSFKIEKNKNSNQESTITKTKNDLSTTIACLDQIIESILYRIKEIDKEVPYLRKKLEEGADWLIYELDTKTELETELASLLDEKSTLKLIIKGEYGKNGNVSYLRSEDEDEEREK